MTYHKRPAIPRTCAHCGTSFQAAHKARRYCSNSCNTLAWRTRKLSAGPVARTELGAPLGPASPNISPPVPTPLSCDLQTVGVVALGTAIGNMATKAGAAIFGELVRPADPGQWLPPAVRAAGGPPRMLWQPGWDTPRLFESLNFYSHALYYRATDRLLFWESTPGSYVPLTTQACLAELATRAPSPAPAVYLSPLVSKYVPSLLAAPAPTVYPSTDDDPTSKFRTVG